MGEERGNDPTLFETIDRGKMVITRLGSSAIVLPEQRPDPALEVQKDGKRTKGKSLKK